MRLRNLILLAGLSLATLPMMADTFTEYTYSGVVFATADAPYDTTTDSITGSFTSVTVGDDLTLTTVTPISFSFTDDHQTFDQGNSTLASFSITTDSSGDITGWSILLSNSGGLISSLDTSGDTISNGSLHAATPDAGSWTSQLVVSAVPEPSSLALLGTGVLGLAGTARRRFLR